MSQMQFTRLQIEISGNNHLSRGFLRFNNKSIDFYPKISYNGDIELKDYDGNNHNATVNMGRN
jgi:hypothetical protein